MDRSEASMEAWSEEENRWPFDVKSFKAELDDGHEIRRSLERFEHSLLSTDTQLCILHSEEGDAEVSENIFGLEDLKGWLNEPGESHKGKHYIFVNRFLVTSNRKNLPPAANKLQISSQAFRLLTSHFEVPPSFVWAVSHHFLPTGRSSISISPQAQLSVSEIWYIIPMRIQVRCNDRRKGHTHSTAGSNQMDPFHYLHLQDAGVDIRGSQIAIFFRNCSERDSSLLIAVNFMDGRWSKPAEEPKRRIKDALNMSRHGKGLDEYAPHTILISSVLKWWINALTSVHEQLLACEKALQEEIDTETQRWDTNNNTSRLLHSIAAHLHRYSSELDSLHDILRAISDHRRTLQQTAGRPDEPKFVQICQSFGQLGSQLKQAKSFVDELEQKLQNILALLFNRIQITNDRSMVLNGQKMHAILLATQEDAKISREIAKQSYAIAEEMKEDSVAMKTIAITTMFFLPGTSAAAFLAMPFFATDKYFSDTAKIWVWIVCTVPATILAFAMYYYRRWHDEQRKKRRKSL